MAKEFFPKNRQWTQPNDGGGTLRATFGVDFFADRGKVRVSKPVNRLFDKNTDIDKHDSGTVTPDGGEKINTIAGAFAKYNDDYYANANVPYYTRNILSSEDPTDSQYWFSEESSNAPDFNGDAVAWDDKLIVIDNTVSAAVIRRYNGTNWATWWGSGGEISGTSGLGDFRFLVPSTDGNLYIIDEDNYVHRAKPDDTKNLATASSPSNQGTLDFSSEPYYFTCTADNSTRLFIGFKNTDTGRGGVIEWDRSATSVTANRVHKLSSIPRCMGVIDDLVVAVMSDGSVKYFDGTRFVNYPGMHLPKIDGRYEDDFVHHNGWAVIDNMLHFLIKGGKSVIGSTNGQERDIKAEFTFPSAVYCLDPQVGLYPRFSLSNNLTQGHYSQPTVATVGALYSLEIDESKFFASYEVYADNSSTTTAVIAYHDESNSLANKGYILYNDYEKAETVKNIEVFHRLLASGNKLRFFYQEYEADDQVIEGVWASTTQLNTTDTVDIDKDWIGWVKTGAGAGQFLRVNTLDDSNTTNIITFKDANTLAILNNESAIQFIKFKWMGDIDGTTKDFHTLKFPSNTKTRKIKILVELTKAASTTTELDYSIIET